MSTQSVTLCQCVGNVNNLGIPGCLPELGAPKRFWFGQVNKVDGTRNAIDPLLTLDLAYMNTFLKNEEPADRLLPTDTVQDFLPEKADPVTEEAASGAMNIVREGVVTHVAVFWVNDPYTYKALFDSKKCKPNAVWIEDTNGNLIGEATSDGKLGGRKVEVNSMNSIATDAKFDERAKLTVTWSYELSSGDEKVSYIKAADFASDFKTSEAVALLDADGEFVGTPGTLGGSYRMFLLYGSIGGIHKIPITGFDETNIEMFNETVGPASVTLTAFSDAITDGLYVYTHSVQAATNVVHMQGVTTTIQKDIDTKALNAITGIITS